MLAYLLLHGWYWRFHTDRLLFLLLQENFVEKVEDGDREGDVEIGGADLLPDPAHQWGLSLLQVRVPFQTHSAVWLWLGNETIWRTMKIEIRTGLTWLISSWELAVQSNAMLVYTKNSYFPLAPSWSIMFVCTCHRYITSVNLSGSGHTGQHIFHQQTNNIINRKRYGIVLQISNTHTHNWCNPYPTASSAILHIFTN